MNNHINVLIAEDHTLTAKLLARLLTNTGFINVVEVVFNGLDVLDEIGSKKVDVILMDIEMPLLDGIKVTERVHREKPEIKVLILSGNTEYGMIERSLQSGASGYLTKKVDTNEVVEAIKMVSNGENYLDNTSLYSIISHTQGDYKFRMNVM